MEYSVAADDIIMEENVQIEVLTKGPASYFACKQHLTIHGVQKNAKKKQMTDVDRKRQKLAFRMCNNDRKIFKQSTIGIRQNDIEVEVIKIDAKSLQDVYAVVPIDCTEIVSPHNIAVVSRKERKMLIHMFQANDIMKYSQTIRHIINMQEKTMEYIEIKEDIEEMETVIVMEDIKVIDDNVEKMKGWRKSKRI